MSGDVEGRRLEAQVTLWAEAERPATATQLERQGLDPALATLLARRGVVDRDQAERFLAPRLEDLHPPDSLPGISAAVARIVAARDAGEKVAVVGDYDADGICGTAILSACLGLAGIDVETILPHRLRDGYGFQPRHAVEAAERGCGLVVTVDCGMSSHEAVEAAKERALEVIVTDHHLSTDEAPSALVIVNPRVASDEETTFNPDLCGAGIAFKLGIALLDAVGREPPVGSLLRVACIGTIADLVPLSGENRSIAALGLQALGEVRSPGLRALMDVARIRRPVQSDDIGFRLGPRLNAAGRLDAPDDALELLLTRDRDRARTLASRLDQWNQERQAEERAVVEEARDRFRSLPELPRFLVAWSPEWHRGVVGIAAGRLAKELHRPTLLLQDVNGEATGSGRSIDAIHLHSFLHPWSSRLARFGGHRQAIGLTVETSSLPSLVEEWNRAAAAWQDDVLVKRHTYELESASVAALRDRLYPELERFQPFGQDNPAPVLRVGPLRTARAPRRFGNGHLDLMVEDVQGGRIGVQAWHWGERATWFDDRFEILARLSWDDYLGVPALVLVDAKPL